MSTSKNILVIGATGLQGGAVARALLGRGHHVRALVRNVESDAPRQIASLGAELVKGDSEDRASVERAAAGVDTVYAMTSFFTSGLEAEVRQGKTIADAVKDAGVGHLVYASVGSADQATGIPHFDSKYEIEKHIVALGIPHTIVGPVFFYENLLNPWSLPGLIEGKLAQPVPANVRVQQIPVEDIASFISIVIENPARFLNRRIDIASDELTGLQAAKIVAAASGRPIEYVEVPMAAAYEMSADAAKMFEWFGEVGYTADIETLRRDYPEVGWHTFEQWVQAQDWSVLDAENASSDAA